ncbi:MAG: universal stress protein [Thaumarchaeota archaeon]|nr:universal stress protein [Nitrososphaerota archaeon]
MIKKKIKKILVPMDGSKNSFKGLDEAIYLARQCGSTITGIHVASFYPTRLEDVLIRTKKVAFAQAKKFMMEAQKISAQNGIVFNDKITYGDTKYDIVEFANDKKFDLIVIGSRGFGPVKEMLLGSVTNSVVHKSKVPVLVVK